MLLLRQLCTRSSPLLLVQSAAQMYTVPRPPKHITCLEAEFGKLFLENRLFIRQILWCYTSVLYVLTDDIFRRMSVMSVMSVSVELAVQCLVLFMVISRVTRNYVQDSRSRYRHRCRYPHTYTSTYRYVCICKHANILVCMYMPTRQHTYLHANIQVCMYMDFYSAPFGQNCFVNYSRVPKHLFFEGVKRRKNRQNTPDVY